MVDVRELKTLYEAKPFKPFVIRLQDGRQIRIDQPEMVGWSSDAAILTFPAGPDAVDWVDFSRITDVRVYESKYLPPKGTAE